MRNKLLERAKQLVSLKASSRAVAMTIDVSVGRSAFLGWSSETSHALRKATDELDAVAVWSSIGYQSMQSPGLWKGVSYSVQPSWLICRGDD